MSTAPPPKMRTFVGFIWIGDQPAIRLSVEASSVEGARALVIEEYGEGHVVSIWNEDDASSQR